MDIAKNAKGDCTQGLAGSSPQKANEIQHCAYRREASGKPAPWPTESKQAAWGRGGSHVLMPMGGRREAFKFQSRDYGTTHLARVCIALLSSAY